MKKLLFFALAFLPIFVLQSCSDSNKDEPESEGESTLSIIGVWESGNHFISFGSDGFYAAYIADEFIDSGSYVQSKDVVSCQNTYFNRKTTYTIKSISDTELKADITYTDVYGNSHNETMTFSKTTTSPASQGSTLVGKSCTWSSSTFGSVAMTFSTYNSGIKSASKGSAAKYPLKFFYVYIGERLYYQVLGGTSVQTPTIGGWSTGFYTLNCWKLFFSSNGSISDFESVAL